MTDDIIQYLTFLEGIIPSWKKSLMSDYDGFCFNEIPFWMY